MKKLCTAMLLAFVASLMAVMAQTPADRVLLRNYEGDVQGFLADRIDSIFFAEQDGVDLLVVRDRLGIPYAFDYSQVKSADFARLEGDVRANIKVTGVKEGDNPSIGFIAERTPQCVAFSLALVEPWASDYLKSEDLAAYYVQTFGVDPIFEDWEGELSNMEAKLAADATYALATVGYDEYGIPCGVSYDTFKTSKPEIVGNPTVTATVVDVTETSFTIRFVPNSDCKAYSICSFDNGTPQDYFDQFKTMFRFNTIDEMITAWSGEERTRADVFTWNHMTPGTDYEVWIAVKDANGNYGERVVVPVTTKSFGGAGQAEVSIEIMEFAYNSEYQVYTQTVGFYPNKDTMLFRDMLLKKEALGSEDFPDENAVIAYLTDDANGENNNYWNLYEDDVFPWTVDPETEYIAYAIAKNSNGEWGPLAKKEFTTPEGKGIFTMPPMKAPQRKAAAEAAKAPALGTARPELVPVVK